MTYTNSTIFFDQYAAMKHHLAEQETAKLKGLFSEEVHTGEHIFFDRIAGFAGVNEVTGLSEDIVHDDTSFSRRLCTITNFDKSVLIHDIEKVKMVVDPTNDIVRKLKAVHARNYDEIVINSLLGTAYTGKTGTTPVTFDSNNVIAHGSAAMTLEKFNQALRIMEENDIDTDSEDVFCILSPRAKEDLLAITNFISTDFVLTPTLAGRMLPTYRGVKFVTSNRIPDATAGSVYRAIMCTGSALKIAKYGEPMIDISQRKDKKNFPYQLYTQSSLGAVRMEENLVIDILFQ